MDYREWESIREAVEEDGQIVLFLEEGSRYHRIVAMGEQSATLQEKKGFVYRKDEELTADQFFIARPAYRQWVTDDAEEKVVPDKGMPGRTNCVKRTHPSYGGIQISRVSGGATLFDSELNHQHYIELRIKRAHISEDDHETRVWPEGSNLIEIQL